MNRARVRAAYWPGRGHGAKSVRRAGLVIRCVHASRAHRAKIEEFTRAGMIANEPDRAAGFVLCSQVRAQAAIVHRRCAVYFPEDKGEFPFFIVVNCIPATRRALDRADAARRTYGTHRSRSRSTSTKVRKCESANVRMPRSRVRSRCGARRAQRGASAGVAGACAAADFRGGDAAEARAFAAGCGACWHNGRTETG